MAHKKGQGSSRNGRDSQPKFLAVKRFDGQFVRGDAFWFVSGALVLNQAILLALDEITPYLRCVTALSNLKIKVAKAGSSAFVL